MDFAGFLFGNVNEEGELEDEEVLDKVCAVRNFLPHTLGLGCNTQFRLLACTLCYNRIVSLV